MFIEFPERFERRRNPQYILTAENFVHIISRARWKHPAVFLLLHVADKAANLGTVIIPGAMTYSSLAVCFSN
jgi:hypothetical protein